MAPTPTPPAVPHRTQIRRIGNGLGFTIPRALLEEAGLREGDPVSIEVIDGALHIRPADEAALAMALGRRFLARDRGSFEKLLNR